jgi:hypothetical protein
MSLCPFCPHFLDIYFYATIAYVAGLKITKISQSP